MTSAEFVIAALAEVGQADVAEFIYANRAGDPAFRWRDMGRYPLPEEVDAVIQAFDLWYRRHPLERPGCEWRGRRQGDVGEWLDLIHAVGRW